MGRKREDQVMDLRHVEEVVKDSEGGLVEKKDAVVTTWASIENGHKSSLDSARALQLFLDRIPINSISDTIIKNPFPEVESKTTDSVGCVIRLLHEKNIKTVPAVHKFGDKHNKQRVSDEYIGLIDLDALILWFLQEYDNSQALREDDGSNEMESKGFFSMLEQNPPVVQTKLQVVHVIEQSESKVIGFVSQNAVIRTLLQASGLEWFDSIADKSLSECRFENEQVVQILGDQSVAEAIHVLREKRIGAIAVTEPEIEKLIGSVRNSDIYLLLEDDDLYSNRKSMKVKDFIQLDANRGESHASTKECAAVTLSLRNNILPRMISPVTKEEN